MRSRSSDASHQSRSGDEQEVFEVHHALAFDPVVLGELDFGTEAAPDRLPVLGPLGIPVDVVGKIVPVG
ncbi:MAG: hypothetical protein ACYDEP_07380 [Acidimicrobiales bacterium]